MNKAVRMGTLPVLLGAVSAILTQLASDIPERWVPYLTILGGIVGALATAMHPGLSKEDPWLATSS